MNISTTSATYFWDEIEKLGASRKRRKFPWRGVAIGAAAGTALGLSRLPGTRANLRAMIKGVGKGGSRKVDAARPLPQGAKDEAARILKALKDAGVDPKKSRIAVSGTGGTGKSTTAKALAEQAGTRVFHYDKPNMTAQQISTLSRKQVKPGVYEQTHMLAEADPGSFDVFVHMRKDPKVVKAQLMARKRGAWQADFYRTKKIDQVLSKGFKELPGEEVRASPISSVKIAPKGGFPASRGSERASRLQREAAGIKGDGGRHEYFKKGKLTLALMMPGAGMAVGAGVEKRGPGSGPSPAQIHRLAKSKGIESDSHLPGSGAFMSMSEDLTGKGHLDQMSPAQRRRIYGALMLA